MSEKTEKATPQKVKDSRKKGQVGQSQDIHKLMILGVLMEVVLGMVESGVRNLEKLTAIPLSMINQPFEYALQATVVNCLTIAASMIVMALGIAVVLRLMGGWLQFGFLIAPEALKIDFNKLNPFNQLKNMFSGKKLFELFNSFVKAITIGVIMYFILLPILPSLGKLALTDLDTTWRGIAELFLKVERAIIGVLIVIASIDFGMQKYFHAKSLKMSKDDVKQEYKNQEGDPHFKGQRKSEAIRLANEEPAPAPSVKPELGDADALVVNPTHFAVALYYRAEETPLPKILTKGEDQDALDLIEQAKSKGIPVIRFIWLARTLYKEKEGHYIPRTTLRYVAKIYQVLGELERDTVKMSDGVLRIPDLETQ
ncbi:type III secretion system export apparatus subunit SctU [Marinomonas balearica]|uniref:Type III secretion protein U n=1 Tax=Marinomonas balearica TaxID=491947 RepID=A0A4V3CGL7_9GAMM|nr:type III secretion system export apparatus subunit SctU [Marinomonas balearica]TDO98242.1 type III secretion protein U [Marinomonas balearica]